MLNSVWIVGINTIVVINIGACIGLGIKRRNVGIKINIRIIRIGVDGIGIRIRFNEKVTALIDVNVTKPRSHSCRD